ncbi:MAG: hypothetical protein J6Y25_02110 [Elusimicrobiaceae bacterium]|nr:hypothetical protein [Elusimicrobiaceae bacterium]MBP5616488.1 hypothetical protein [Elusimicrobiaceae bacterium]
MTEPNNVEQPFVMPSKRTIWTVRLVLLALVALWVGVGIYFHMEAREARAKVEHNRLEAQRQEQRLRRETNYKQRVQDRTYIPATRNAVDGR